MAGAFTQVLGEAGAGEKVIARLVERDGQDAVIIVKSGLDTIAVVGVDVDVGHAPTFGQHAVDGDCAIAKDAKAGGKVMAGVVQSPGKAEGDIGFVVK